jgi:hypothetical protein
LNIRFEFTLGELSVNDVKKNIYFFSYSVGFCRIPLKLVSLLPFFFLITNHSWALIQLIIYGRPLKLLFRGGNVGCKWSHWGNYRCSILFMLKFWHFHNRNVLMEKNLLIFHGLMMILSMLFSQFLIQFIYFLKLGKCQEMDLIGM